MNIMRLIVVFSGIAGVGCVPPPQAERGSGTGSAGSDSHDDEWELLDGEPMDQSGGNVARAGGGTRLEAAVASMCQRMRQCAGGAPACGQTEVASCQQTFISIHQDAVAQYGTSWESYAAQADTSMMTCIAALDCSDVCDPAERVVTSSCVEPALARSRAGFDGAAGNAASIQDQLQRTNQDVLENMSDNCRIQGDREVCDR